MKQSSVEWLESIVNAMIQNGGDNDLLAVIEHIQKAKAMHKEEIVKAWSNGYVDKDFSYFDPEQYYNQTFGGKQ